MKTGGSVVCWGASPSGEAEPPAGSFGSVSASIFYHTCGVKTGGEIVCWGSNASGQAAALPGLSYRSVPGHGTLAG